MRHCPNCGTKFTNHEAFCPYDGTPTLADTKEHVDPWVGVVVDNRYRIESRIGEGGMGIVYRASHVLLNKRIAIKIVRADHAKDNEVAERFMQEARAATSIGHPNIIDINDFGRMPDGSVYFAMEYLDGRGLDDLMENGPLPMDVAIHIVEQITSALGAAHDRGIVHRDLKPDNIFLIKHRDDTNFVKVLDFGIAKVAGGSSRTTRTGMVFGTPHYMSPEQAAGQSVDHRTDIYALGVMMYEMFTGQLPFDAETFMGVLTMHMYDPPPLPSSISPAVAERINGLEGVVLRALSKKPDLRYQTMAALREDMRAVYFGERKSLPLDKTLIAGGAIADTVPPPPAAPAAGNDSADDNPFDAAALDQAAAGLLQDDHGALVTSPTPTRASMPRWVMFGAAAVLGLGAIAWASSGNDDAPPPATATAPTTAAAPRVETPAEPTETTPSPAVVDRAPMAAPIEIASDPSGAQVFEGDALLGTTPLSLPRPSDAAIDLQLKHDGHRAVLLRVLPTSPERIVATLARETPSKRANKATSKPTKGNSTTQPPATKKTQGTVGLRDMVDPWNE